MRVALVVWASLLLLGASSAWAQIDEERLRLMHETSSYTDVADAFDGQDRFDLNVRLGYSRLREQGAIYRERTRADGRRYAAKVGQSSREVSQLALEVDVGLYRDLMAFVRMPLILSDARAVRAASGRSAAQTAADLQEVSAAGGATHELFALPLTSPTRAGLDYVAFGAAWAVLNQMRRPALPTWVVRIEGRRAIGKPLRACRESAEGTLCGSRSSEDRDGDGLLDGTRAQSGAGSSRGVSALLLETRFSRRYRRVEPYAGLALLVEWPSTAKRAFLPKGRGEGSARLPRARPGPESSATLGVAIVPWENRGTFQRLVIDVRLSGTHVGAGTDYSPLFDGLGSSSHPELARDRYEGVRGTAPATGGPVAPCTQPSELGCGLGQRVPFLGVTEIAPHLRYGGQLGVEVQAARYVRFALGSSLQWVTPHMLTGRAGCTGDARGATYALADDGRICAEGQVDPRHRGVIDGPGRRFELREQLLLGVYAQATALF